MWCRWFCSRVAAVHHAFVCQPHAVMWSSKRWKREGGDVGLWVRKQDLVRRILACRGQPLRSANIIIRFSVRLHLSNIECRLCCCFSYWFSLHQVQHVFAIQSSCMATRKLLIGYIPKQIISPASTVSGVGLLGEWLQARGWGGWICTIFQVITQCLPPAAYCHAMCTPRYRGTWGIWSVLHYQNLNYFADKVYWKWKYISIDYPHPHKAPTLIIGQS